MRSLTEGWKVSKVGGGKGFEGRTGGVDEIDKDIRCC